MRLLSQEGRIILRLQQRALFIMYPTSPYDRNPRAMTVLFEQLASLNKSRYLTHPLLLLHFKGCLKRCFTILCTKVFCVPPVSPATALAS